jgi:hypothetical protein
MLKKSQAQVLAPIDATFVRRVAALATDGHALAKSYADLTARMIRFAERFNEIWNEAKRLDKADRGRHHEHLRGQIAKAVGTDRQDVWSKWNTIGSQAPKLLEYKKSLPPQRESLYEVALALDEKKPVERWIENSAITSTSTVREVAALRKGKKRQPRQRSYLASVIVEFQTYDEAADAMKQLLLSDHDFRIRSHQAFDEAVKSKMHMADYELAKKRIA